MRIRAGDKFVDTYGMLETESDASLISSDVADQRGLRGEVKPMTFGTFYGSEPQTQAFTIPRLNASMKIVNWDRIKALWDKTYGIVLSSGPEGEVTLLIGADVLGAHEHIEIKKPPRGVTVPYAVLTPFGWSVFSSKS